MFSSVFVIVVSSLYLIEFSICLSINKTHDHVVLGFHGPMPAVFTVIYDNQTLNLGLIPEYAQYFADNDFKGVSVGGTTGEGMSLSVEERKALHEAWVKAGKDNDLHVQVQVGGAPLPDVISLAKHAGLIGAHSILTLPELYMKPNTVDDLVSYVETVAKAVPNKPVLYYHNPGHSGVTVNMASFAVAATARIPNFKGLKFTSNDLKEAADTLRVLNKDQEIFLGSDPLMAPAGLLGIRSYIGGGINLFPKLTKEILEAVDDSDILKARKLQERLSLALSVIGGSKSALKAGMEVVTGIKVGPPRLPSKPLSANEKKKMATQLRAMGFDVKYS